MAENYPASWRRCGMVSSPLGSDTVWAVFPRRANGRLQVFRGDDWYEWEPSTDTWTQLSTDIGAQLINRGYIYRPDLDVMRSFAGRYGSYNYDDCYEYDLEAETETALNLFGDGDEQHVQAVQISGSTCLCFTDYFTYEYDWDSDTYTEKTDMSFNLEASKGKIGFGVYGGKVYVIGESGGSYDGDKVLEFDPVANAWTAYKTGGLPNPSWGPAATYFQYGTGEQVGNHIVFVPGYTNHDRTTYPQSRERWIVSFDIPNKTWHSWDTVPDHQEWAYTHYHGLFHFRGEIFLSCGGTDMGGMVHAPIGETEVSGVVRDKDGALAAGVTVWVVPKWAPHLAMTGTTDGSGEFSVTLPTLGPGQYDAAVDKKIAVFTAEESTANSVRVNINA